MARPKSKGKKTHLSLSFDDCTMDRIGRILKWVEADSMKEVIRRALQCYEAELLENGMPKES